MRAMRFSFIGLHAGPTEIAEVVQYDVDFHIAKAQRAVRRAVLATGTGLFVSGGSFPDVRCIRRWRALCDALNNVRN